MEVTGYRIREALRRQQLARDTADGQFKDSLHAFENEVKQSPQEVMEKVLKAETAIAKLQVIQTRYNLGVVVDVQGEGRCTLMECIKRIGGLGRVEKRWRSAATVKEDRYGYGSDLTRNKDQMVAQRTITLDEASAKTAAFDRRLAALREAINIGNGQKLELDLDVALFE